MIHDGNDGVRIVFARHTHSHAQNSMQMTIIMTLYCKFLFLGFFFSVSKCPHRTHTTHTIFHTFEIIYTINWKQRQLMEVLGSPRYKHTLTLAGTLLPNEHFYSFTATLSFHLENLSLFLSLSLSLCLSLAVCTSPSVLVYKRNKSLCLCYAYDILIIT